MATRKKIDKFVYLYEKDKVKGLFGNIELFNSNINSTDANIEEPVEEAVVVKPEPIPTPVLTEAVLTTSKSCSCCQVRFDSGKHTREERGERERGF